MDGKKRDVHDFCNRDSCGESLYLLDPDKEGYMAQAPPRYRLEGDLIFGLAHFAETKGLKVLEVGVGLGADHQEFTEAGADLFGIDLTERAIHHTKKRLETFGLVSKLAVGDAENLYFPRETFDRVYSWGVLHHTPDTPKAVAEVWRVLKKGGEAGIMIYHKWSIVGFMLWLRYALLGLKPWLTLNQTCALYLESPGTNPYFISEAQRLFSAFSEVKIRTALGHGDLLESNAGQRYQGPLLSLAKKIWPRRFIRRFLPNSGLCMLVEVKK